MVHENGYIKRKLLKAFWGPNMNPRGPLVALFDFPRTNDNFRATAGIFEEINVPRRGRRGIRRQISSFVNPISKITHRMARAMIQIRRYIRLIDPFIVQFI